MSSEVAREASTARREIDLGRKGVVWLEGTAIPVERTGARRAVARLSQPEPERTVDTGRSPVPEQPTGSQLPGPGRRSAAPVVAAAFGGTQLELDLEPERGRSQVLLAGGRRKRDSLGAIDRWYRRLARERIESEVAAEAARLGLNPGMVSIRDQKTRWGSCSTSGTLSFNWRLVIGPHEALRYVVIHELVHITHHNHSRAFWSALTEAMPEWKRPAAWLKANERSLTVYRPKL